MTPVNSSPTPRFEPTRPLSRTGGPDEQTAGDSRVALVAAEALSLVIRSCSTRPAIQALQRLAHARSDVLEAAADRARQVTDLDARIRQAAAALLKATASACSRGAVATVSDAPPAGRSSRRSTASAGRHRAGGHGEVLDLLCGGRAHLRRTRRARSRRAAARAPAPRLPAGGGARMRPTT